MGASAHREVELKFRLSDPGPLALLRAADRLLEQFDLGPLRSQDTLDLYWDTADYALARGGFGLRTRRQNGHWLVTLKEFLQPTASALTDRVEVESAWTGEAVHEFFQRPKLGTLIEALAQPGWPPPAWTQVVRTEKNPQLSIVAPLHQHRDKRDLRHMAEQNGQIIGELSLDTVHIYPLTMTQGAQLVAQIDAQKVAPLQTYYELELEAKGTTQGSELAAIADPMADAFTLQPSATGKAESALRLLARLAADGTPAIQPETPMMEAGRAIWRQELMEVILGEVGVRCAQDSEAVHDVRVAYRRMRAAYRIMGPYYDSKQIRPFVRKMRKTASILGAARDLDIALDLLRSYRKTLKASGKILKPVMKSWKAERHTAYAAAQAWLTGKAYGRFLADFVSFCYTPDTDAAQSTLGATQSTEVRHVMPAEIFAHYVRMRSAEATLGPDAPVEALHQLRIDGKRLRYAVEFVQHLLAPEPTAQLLKKLKLLQDCLGAVNDAVVIQERLHSFAHAHPSTNSLGEVIAGLDEIIAQQRVLFADLWTDFIGVETRTQLALAIASL